MTSEVEEDERQWSDLPELILHAIAMKLPGPADLLTFAGVCRSWRSIPYFSSIEFFSSLPRPIFSSSLYPCDDAEQPFSRTLFLYSPQDYNVIYKYHSSAKYSNQLCIGISNGHFITIDKATRTIVSVINPFTAARTVFPKICFNFQYALLTEADIAHPDCRLVLIDKKNDHILYCLPSDWWWRKLKFSTRYLTDAIFYKGRLYLVWFFEQIFEYDFRTNLFRELDERSPFEGRLAESPYGDLVMLGLRTPFLVCWKVMLAPKEDASLEDRDWDRTFEWPAGKKLMFRWQMCDAKVYPMLATTRMRRKVVAIDQRTTFWKNYLEHSPPPCSNGVYVTVDDHGSPKLSNLIIF